MTTLPTVGATTAQDSPSHSGQHNTTADDHNYFYVNGPDKTAINQAPGGGTGSRHTIFEGAAATPVTSNVNSTLVVSRYSAMTSATSANPAAITAINVDHGTLTQAVGVHAEAEQVNTGDACASLNYATIAATASISGGHKPTAFGAFAFAQTLLTTGRTIGMNPVLGTLEDKTFLGDGGSEVTSGVFIQCTPMDATKAYKMGTAVLVESTDITHAHFDVGLGFFAGSVVTTGIDMTQLTLSDSYFKMQTHFRLTLSGTDPDIEFDSGDSLIFTRSNDAFVFQVGASPTLEVSTGFLSFTGLPSTNPGAGFNLFWYDPTDGNRVKFAP